MKTRLFALIFVLFSLLSSQIVYADITAESCDAILAQDGSTPRLVDDEDFTAFSSYFGSVIGDSNYNAQADFDDNGAVDFTDFNLFSDYYGDTCNRAPVIAPISDKTLNEGGVVTVSASATDEDGDSLDYTLTHNIVGNPPWYGAQSITWWPAYTQAGDWQITVTVDDGYETSTKVVNIHVNNVNRKPSFSDGITSKSVNENDVLTFTIVGSDPDSEDTATLSAVSLPDDSTFDANTGVFTWDTDFLDSGSYSATFSVTDGSLLEEKTVSITVDNTNRAPVIETINGIDTSQEIIILVNEGQSLEFDVVASDPDPGDTFIMSSSGVPPRATYDNGRFSWTPSYGQGNYGSKDYSVTFTASQGTEYDREQITIRVIDSNAPPSIDLVSPINNQEFGNTWIRFEWSGNDDGNVGDLRYDLYLYKNGESERLIQGGYSGQYMWQSLNSDSDYRWFVIARDGEGYETKSSVFTVKTLPHANERPDSSISRPRNFITTEEHPSNFIRHNVGELIYFAGTGTDTDGTISAYDWNFDGAATNVNYIDHIVRLNTAGDYNIQFKTMDNNNAWDDTPASLRLIVDTKPSLNLESFVGSNSPIDINNIEINIGTLLWFRTRGDEPDKALMNDFVKEVRVEYGDGNLYGAPYFSDSNNVVVTQDSNNIYSYKLINDDENFFSEVRFTYSTLGTRTLRFIPIDSFGLEGDPIEISVSVVTPPPPPPPPNDAPVANDDSITINEDVSTLVNVLSNDNDIQDGKPSIDAITSGPSNGAISIESGQIRYTPNANYFGSDSFTYRVKDSRGDIDTASVSITINSVEDNPVAVADSVSVAEDGSVLINVIANDYDVETSVSLNSIGAASNGATVIESGKIRYTPTADYFGSDSFTYTIIDGASKTATGTVSVTVNPVNDNPVIVADTASTNEDVSVLIDVLANDNDIEAALTIDSLGAATNGVVAIESGKVRYTPSSNYFGADSFTYTAKDSDGATGTVTVTLTINSVNDLPNAVADTATTDEDVSVLIDVMANDNDVENGISIDSVTQGTNGAVAIEAGKIRYTPNANYNGADSFTYVLIDNELATSTATVSVTINSINDGLPVATDDSASTNEDNSVLIDVLANDNDVDGAVTINSVGTATKGVVVIESGKITYTPNSNYFGADSFTYVVIDSDGATDSATVTMTVNSVNDLPDAVDDTGSVDEDGTVLIDVMANDFDVENGISINSVTQGTNGAVVIESGKVRYTPNSNYFGSDSFTYVLIDNELATSTATVTVTVDSINDNPVVVADTSSTNEDTSVLIDVLANDNDVEAALTIDSIGAATNGVVAIESGKVRYTPNANYFGADSFTYTAIDSDSITATATVTITVNSVNDLPTAVADTSSVDEDGTVLIDVLSNDNDVESVLTINSVGAASNGVVAIESGKVRYTPNTNYFGSDSFTYTAIDSDSATVIATVTVTINSINDAPQYINTFNDISFAEDTTTNFIDLYDSDQFVDVEHIGQLTFTYTPMTNIQLSINDATGVITFSADADFSGTESTSITATDPDGLSDTTNVFSITVTPVNDLPTAVDDTSNTPEDTSVLIDVLANDNDIESVLALDSVGTATNGLTGITSGKITYTPNLNFFGTDSFTYTIIDGDSATVSATVTVSVGPINDPPILSSGVTPLVGNRNTVFVYDVTYTDVENDAPVGNVLVYIDGTSFIMTAQNPADTVYTDGAVFIYSRTMGIGSHNFYFVGSDGMATTTSTTYSGPTVNNNAPTMNSIGNRAGLEASLLQFTISGTDPDGDGVTYSANGLPSGAVLDTNSGTFTWTPTYDQSGTHNVEFVVTDSELSGTESVVFTISNTNRVPNVNSPGNKNTAENTLLSFVVTGNDADDDPLTYTTSLLPSGASFDANTQTFTWTPDYTQAGTYTVRFGVTDGILNDMEEITITVDNVNGPPGLNAIGDKQGVENSELTFTLSANDPDSTDVLNYIGSNLPTGASFSNGVFSWTPGFNQNGVYQNIRFTVTDGSFIDSEEITIIILNKDRNPVVSSSPLKEITVLSPTEDTIYQYDVDATDADGDDLVFSLQKKPTGMTIDKDTGLITWSVNKKDKGKHEVRVMVYDGKGGYGIQRFTIKVELGRQVESSNSKDVKIAKVNLAGGQYYKPGDFVTVTVGFSNYGEKNVKNLRATVSFPDLGIVRKVGPVYLESGEEETRSTFLELPEDTPPGEYVLRVRSSGSSKSRHRFIYVE